MKTGKVWGETKPLLATSGIEIHQLVILPHAHCSRHRHSGRWNAFYVTHGRLMIEVRQTDRANTSNDIVDTTELRPGEMTTVAPGVVHRFRTECEGAHCIEIYYPAGLGAADIERLDVGGRQL